MSTDDGLLLHRLAVYVGDGLPALRIEDLARRWRTFGRERAPLRIVAEAWDMAPSQVKRRLLLDALTEALDTYGSPGGPPADRAGYRALLVSVSVKAARERLQLEAAHYEFYALPLAAEPSALVTPAEPPVDAADEERQTPPDRYEEVVSLPSRSEDRRALREAFLVHGCSTLKEAAGFLVKTRGWPKQKAYTVASRWRDQDLRRRVV